MINLAALRAQAEEASRRGEAVLLEPGTVLGLVERCEHAEEHKVDALEKRVAALEAALGDDAEGRIKWIEACLTGLLPRPQLVGVGDAGPRLSDYSCTKSSRSCEINSTNAVAVGEGAAANA